MSAKGQAMSDVKTIELELEKIRLDGGTQSRVRIERKAIGEYAERMLAGDVFPSLSVFFDGSDYWLADGFHRFYASQRLRRTVVSVAMHIGTKRDAILYSLGANSTHGLRRTSADKRKAVNIMLADEYWSQWSNREIARRCGVSETMVRRSRISPKGQSRKFITRHGRVTEMQVSNIGKNRSHKKKTIKPEVSVSLLKEASKIVRENGRDYAEALIASLRHYLKVTRKNPEGSNYNE